MGYSKLQFWKHFNDAQAINLEKNVRAALDKSVLTVECMRKFARKARDYKLTYFFLVKEAAATNDGLNAKNVQASHKRIEQLTKLFKHHWSALDSDHAFIKNV